MEKKWIQFDCCTVTTVDGGNTRKEVILNDADKRTWVLFWVVLFDKYTLFARVPKGHFLQSERLQTCFRLKHGELKTKEQADKALQEVAASIVKLQTKLVVPTHFLATEY